MKLLQSLFLLFNFALLLNALALPASFDAAFESTKELFKRKGGGGGGGRGGSGGSSSSSSSSSSSGSGSGSSGGSRGSGSSGSSSSGGRTSSTSNTGGSSSAGSGPARGYGAGGAYYGGGAAVPYRSGAKSGSVTPYVLGGAALGGLGFLGLYGAYNAYSYPGYYHYHNTSANRNESRPVECICADGSECGCDVKNETDYLNAVANNNTISRVANVNGTDTLVINGTLPNGTTAPGGSDSAASSLQYSVTSSLWVVVGGVIFYFM